MTVQNQDPEPSEAASKNRTAVTGAVIEIVSDSGEGAQTAGQMFGTICAKMGNGVWTVEIIPAEIEPPPRSSTGASGNRVRFATGAVSNMGDKAAVVVAFNEQAAYSRVLQSALEPGTLLYLDRKWATSPDPTIAAMYADALVDFKERGFEIREIPLEEETLKLVDNPRRGKNMWVVGLLCAMYDRDINVARAEITKKFAKKRNAEKIIASNLALVGAGYAWGLENIKEFFEVESIRSDEDRVVMNGNAAVALGAVAAGIGVCSMYPITPATSVSHYLAAMFHRAGGFIHQAEDEIAAVAFAVGTSYAGKTCMTVTSGPGMALKTEMLGLAIMAEVPLVVVNVQRGGPSTGLPTKVEQSDLLSTLYGHPGDAPKIVMAPSTIEECFHYMVTARQLAEAFRTPVFVLTDANLATGQAHFPYPEPKEEWLAPPIDQSPWTEGHLPYAWDPETGISQRAIPGQKGGQYVLTGLAHDGQSHIAYDPDSNQDSTCFRSRKLHTFKKTLKPPVINGEQKGDMLVVGWGSTRGAIEEAVERLKADNLSVSSIHLRFLSPLEPGLKELFAKFKKVLVVELNYCDIDDGDFPDGQSKRYSQLAWVLRARTLVDIDCWALVPGQPLGPQQVADAIRSRMPGAK